MADAMVTPIPTTPHIRNCLFWALGLQGSVSHLALAEGERPENRDVNRNNGCHVYICVDLCEADLQEGQWVKSSEVNIATSAFPKITISIAPIFRQSMCHEKGTGQVRF